MNRRPWCALIFSCLMALTTATVAQQPVANGSAALPLLIKFRGTIPNAFGGTVGVTFLIYSEQSGGIPLWLETQNISVNDQGSYTVYLGANHGNGVPEGLFTDGTPRWLGVQPQGQSEQVRVLLEPAPNLPSAFGNAQTLKATSGVNTSGVSVGWSPNNISQNSAAVYVASGSRIGSQAVNGTAANSISDVLDNGVGNGKSTSQSATEAADNVTSAGLAPRVVTMPPLGGTTTATIVANGIVDPKGLPTTYWFEYSMRPGRFARSASQSLPDDTTNAAVSAVLSELVPHATYYIRLVASNSAGTRQGRLLQFRSDSGGVGVARPDGLNNR